MNRSLPVFPIRMRRVFFAALLTCFTPAGPVLAQDTAPAIPQTMEAAGTSAPAGQPATAETTAPPADPLAAAIEQALDDSGANAAVAEFYTDRAFAPLWIDAGKLSGAARAVIHRLERADIYGLDPARYETPRLDIGLEATASPADLAEAELRLSLAALKFAADARTGTFDPASLGKFTTPTLVRPEPKAVIEGLAAASDRVAYLEAFNPPHPQFAALRKLLADLRDREDADAPPEIGEGPTLKPGMSDERVPALRARLGIAEVVGDGALVYDETTVEAVKGFQERAGLDIDGSIGPQTRASLNGGTDITVADVLVNMERWRWVPRDMGARNVWVNIPEFRLRLMSNGAPEFETRVIVGTPENQTPVFSDEIEYVDANPYWNVPRSIAAKEMMPEIRQDPNYFFRNGLQVIYITGGQEFLIDPRSVDWRLFDGETMPFRFRQPPGGGNALGRVKFMFPNKHAVYLHDTPTRNLFARSVRAYSHGCVRVDRPMEFADALMSREDSAHRERVRKMVAGGENGTLDLTRHVPVHLTYFTVWVDEAGEARKRADIYDYDQRMKASMGLGS